MNDQKVRSASHSGSWYDSTKSTLDKKLSKWLSEASPMLQPNLLRAIIAPHAGYDYSGAPAAWSYININPENYDTVFLLGPCHHKYIKGCGLTKCSIFETPLGNINIDTDTLDELSKNKFFIRVEKEDDEDEHSLEMHLPYIQKIFQKYILNPKILFIISSDFCHWGNNFDYCPFDKNDGQIFKYIEKLDKTGIDYIEMQDPDKFLAYLKDTENTICGKNPITVLLYTLKISGLKTKTSLRFYTQSNQCKKKSDSSVSYGSIITYLDD